MSGRGRGGLSEGGRAGIWLKLFRVKFPGVRKNFWCKYNLQSYQCLLCVNPLAGLDQTCQWIVSFSLFLCNTNNLLVLGTQANKSSPRAGGSFTPHHDKNIYLFFKFIFTTCLCWFYLDVSLRMPRVDLKWSLLNMEDSKGTLYFFF